MTVAPSAREIQGRVAAGETTAVAVTAGFLDRIERHDPDLGAFLAVDREGALAAARAADDRRAAGGAARYLEGVPVAVKDNILVRGLPTTCGSAKLAGWTPPREAEAVRRIRAAGGIPIGKTNLDEFGMGSSGENSAFGPTRNPRDPALVPGGSSSGSAAAVAAGLVPLALGSDTGGSVRQPAAFCGVTGMKPTYGRVSRRGLVAFASSLDQIGCLAPRAEDAARLLTVIAGEDPGDATTRKGDVPAYDRAVDLATLRIGVAPGWEPEVSTDIRGPIAEAIRAFAAAGADIREIPLPHARHGNAAYRLISCAEASSNLARFDGIRFGPADGRFGREPTRRILLGAHVLSSGYRDAFLDRALRVRRLVAEDFRAAFGKVDLILSPTTPETAFRLGERTDDPVGMYRSDVFTVLANLAGLPAISVPARTPPGALPVGLQLTGPAGADRRVLGAARACQESVGALPRLPEAFA